MGSSPGRIRAAVAWVPGLLALVAWSAPDIAFAWVYPEHRDIAIAAVEKLDPERKAELDALWDEARISYKKRLCDQVADSKQSVTPVCIDWSEAAICPLSRHADCSADS
jgi:hypothetical protein